MDEFKDGFRTLTLDLQIEVQDSISKLLGNIKSRSLHKASHSDYLQYAINHGLSKWFVALDASKPWLVYWILHSWDLLNQTIESQLAKNALNTILSTQCKEGGFSGGQGQLPHLATSYAAVNAIAILGNPEAFQGIDTANMYKFLMRMKQPDGSFRMHDGGEVDIRGTYCALNIAVLLNITTPELLENAAEFIVLCQTFEGGLGPLPGVEAHGGYTFCGLAAMALINKLHMLDLGSLTQWVVSRQMEIEGGFQGRTNKLVDGCYSFWQGGAAVILEIYFNSLEVVLNINHRVIHTEFQSLTKTGCKNTFLFVVRVTEEV